MNQDPETVPPAVVSKEEDKDDDNDNQAAVEAALPPEEEPRHDDDNNNNNANRNNNFCRRYCAWRGWCSFPTVPRGAWIAVFSTTLVALILVDAATDVCGFVQGSVYLTTNENTNNSTTTTRVERRHIGINQYEDANGGCVSWRKGTDKDDVYQSDDVMWTVVRYLVGIASVVGLLGLVVLLFASCFAWSTRALQILSHVMQGVWFLYSLSFLALASQTCEASQWEGPVADDFEDCTLDVGAGLMLAGVVLWMPASFGVWYLSYRHHNHHQAQQQQDVATNTDGNESPPDETAARSSPFSMAYAKPWVIVWALLVIASVAINSAVIATRDDFN